MPNETTEENNEIAQTALRNLTTLRQEALVAFLNAQKAIKNAFKTKENKHFGSDYADLSSVMEAIKGPLNDNGFIIYQTPHSDRDDATVRLNTSLVHVNGVTLFASSFAMPTKDASNPQALGSSLTYARRYALMAMTGICPVDDDGNAGAVASVDNFTPAKRVIAAAKTMQQLTDAWNQVKAWGLTDAQLNELSALVKTQKGKVS